MNQSLGVVSIFAASNFPLAFSVMGGDSTSALAAGCPVIVKAHPSHPQTSEVIFQAVQSALRSLGLPAEIFSMVHGQNPELTHWLATADQVTAIGFTGFGLVGKLLVKLAAERKVPIPVFAEMGSINPVFITPNAITERASAIAKGAVESVLMGSGQFCTKPGLFFIPSNSAGNTFLEQFNAQLSQSQVSPLLNPGIHDRFKKSMAEFKSTPAISVIHGLAGTDAGLSIQPTVFIVNAEEFTRMPQLSEEHFGPTCVIVRASIEQYSAIAASLEGQLTTTIHAGANEPIDISELVSELARISGRVIWNGFPTGVAIAAAMNHGGPWPASSTFTTSVGTDAIYRFLRPVSYQSFPDAWLPPALQDSNPWKIERIINGVRG
jgi:NADP-dependent aldehyde dehydrogenase